MEFLPHYDLFRCTFAYAGAYIHDGTGLPAVNTYAPYASPLSAPTANPSKGFFSFTIPNEINRILHHGRCLFSITRVWSGVFGDNKAHWDHEDIICYSNIAQPYGFDNRTYTHTSEVWSGHADAPHNNYWCLNYHAQSLINEHTLQTVCPVPNTIDFQFTSAEDKVAGQQRNVCFTYDGSADNAKSISMQIDCVFIVPRTAIHSGCTPFV